MKGLERLVGWIDTVNEYVGRATAWLALFMVMVQVTIVIMRYVFAIGSVSLQESIFYMHGILFMMAAGYTLLHDGHVRVDIFYREASQKRKALVDLTGVVIFLLPVCVLSWWLAWPYVMNSIAIRETSLEPLGLPFVYLLKTVILLFIVLLSAQGISLALKSIGTLAGIELGRKPETHEGI